MKATREAQPAHIAGFDRIVSDTLGSIDLLLTLAA
jgi:hypothetical protein